MSEELDDKLSGKRTEEEEKKLDRLVKEQSAELLMFECT